MKTITIRTTKKPLKFLRRLGRGSNILKLTQMNFNKILTTLEGPKTLKFKKETSVIFQ